MAFDSGIRKKMANYVKGIDAGWNDSGNALVENGGSQDILGISGPGELRLVRFISKSNMLICRVKMDGDQSENWIVDPYRNRPWAVWTTYGCTGEWGGVHLVRYDTVNDKYILEFHPPALTVFGASCYVGLYNDQGSSIKCCGDVLYGVNASKVFTRHGVGKVDVNEARKALAKSLGLQGEDLTVVWAANWDKDIQLNVASLDVYVHPEIEKAQELEVEAFLAQLKSQ